MRGTCAICVAEIAKVTRREPIGKGDALVVVCDGCALEKVPDPGVRIRKRVRREQVEA